MLDRKHVAFAGRLVIVGFGSIGQGVLPLLLRHLEIDADQITIITAEPRGHDVAAEYGIRFVQTALTRSNFRAILGPQLGDGDFLLNVSVDVSSVALIEFCQERLAAFQVPRFVRVVSELPRTQTQRVEKYRLRDEGVTADTWVMTTDGALQVQDLVGRRFSAVVDGRAFAAQSEGFFTTGRKPVLSTSGGTSDARFIRDYCPVVEFGLVNRSMHGIDEHVAAADLVALTAIYRKILDRYFGRGSNPG